MKRNIISQMLWGTTLSTLLFTALPTQAQTFFGSGGGSNTATTATNVGLGYNALAFNTTGSSNVAIGMQSLWKNTTGFNNTALGYQALNYNTTGYTNVAVGFQSLFSNTTGSINIALGANALAYNTTGSANVANGYQSLYSNTTGNYNSSQGFYTLYANTTGSSNVANGNQTLYANTTGNYNTATGTYALFHSTTGSANLGLGYRAGFNITTGSNNIAIGNQGLATDNGVIRIGTAGNQTTTYISGINGVTSTGGVAVYINSSGQLGTITSSRRFKNEIKSMGSVSDRLLQLRPVTFRYKQADEKGGHPLQYGLIAEEVAKVFPDLVQYDKQGKPYTVFYHLLTPMILNELQKEHKRVESVQASHQAEVTALRAELTALKQAQAEQHKLLVKLAAFVQNQKSSVPLEQVKVVQH